MFFEKPLSTSPIHVPTMCLIMKFIKMRTPLRRTKKRVILTYDILTYIHMEHITNNGSESCRNNIHKLSHFILSSLIDVVSVCD